MDEEALFAAALKKTLPAERQAFLAEACGGDAQCLARVEALLHAHDDPDPFLQPPPASRVPTFGEPMREGPGTVIGPYKLLEPIGEGGFGVVFMAEQQEAVRRKVALKVLKPGMDTRQVIARFEAERQALAMMDHPNIAGILDGGTTASGRPYFVMDLVKGVPITDYCDQNNLVTRERLELFVQVCSAVQHAHQKGVIHRDLKPSNVLVTVHDVAAVVKVIDFGIAKALGQRLTEQTLFTGLTQMLGTPMYMSPEQAGLSSLDVDTRSDIYSLGVLLYELLTGTTPFDQKRLEAAGPDEIRRIIREEEPPRPSTRISTLGQAATTVCMQRKSDPMRLGQLFRGELDWIVMKALEKDRGRRYETAGAFAADVQRYLHDEPVQACPPSAWYRFHKFARRHKAALAVAICVCLAVVLLAVSNVQLQVTQGRLEAARGAETEQRRRAEANLELALDALDEIFIKPAEAEVSAGGGHGNLSLTAQEVARLDRQLLQKGLGFYEQFAQANSSNPRLRGETGKAYNRVGYLHVAMSQHDKAEAAFRKSMSILEPASEESPEVADYRRTLVSDYHWLGHVLKLTGRPREAEEHLRRNVASSERLVADYPDVADYRGHLYQACRALGDFFKETGRLKEAEAPYRRSVDVARQLAADFAGDTRTRREQYYANRVLGDALCERRDETAVPPYLQAADLARQIVADAPTVADHRRDLLLSERSVARLLLHCDRFAEAEQVYRQSIALDEKLSAAIPDLPADRLGPSQSHAGLGDVLCVAGRFREAAEEYRRALAARPAYAEWHWKLSWFLANCPDPQYRDPGQALALAKKALELPREDVEPPGSSLGVGAGRQGFYWRALGGAYFRTGDWDSVIPCLEKSRVAQGGLCTCGWSILAIAHWRRGDKEEALRCYERGCEWLEKHKGGYSKEPGFYWEEEFRRFRAEAAAQLGLPDPRQPAGGESSPSKIRP